MSRDAITLCFLQATSSKGLLEFAVSCSEVDIPVLIALRKEMCLEV